MGGILNTFTGSLNSNSRQDIHRGDSTVVTGYDRDKTGLQNDNIKGDGIDRRSNDRPADSKMHNRVTDQSRQNSKLCFLQPRNMAVTSAETGNDDRTLIDKSYDNVLLDNMYKKQPENEITIAIQKSLDLLQKNLTTSELTDHEDNLSTEGVTFPRFSGDLEDNYIAFVSQLESCFKFLKWSDQTKCNYLPLTLLDRARTYYDNLPTIVTDNYVNLMTALNDKFGMSTIGILKYSDLLERRQGKAESIAEYSKAFMGILQKLNITDEMTRLTSYLRGLRPEIRLAVLPHRPSNISEAEDIAILLEKQIKAVPMDGCHVNQQRVQRDHKPEKGACFHCGHFSHYVCACPFIKKNNLNV